MESQGSQTFRMRGSPQLGWQFPAQLSTEAGLYLRLNAVRESARPGKRPSRALSRAEKMDAVNRVANGETKASVGRDIGVPESTLRGWCKAENKIRCMAKNSSTPAHSQASSSGANAMGGMAASNLSREDEGAPVFKKTDDALWMCLTQHQQVIGAQSTPLAPIGNAQNADSWFWEWYKSFVLGAAQSSHTQSISKQAAIDSALADNNNSFKRIFHVTEDDGMNIPTPEEAIQHGEQFLKYLDNCSDPRVTRLNVMQFKCLLDSIKHTSRNCSDFKMQPAVKRSRN